MIKLTNVRISSDDFENVFNSIAFGLNNIVLFKQCPKGQLVSKYPFGIIVWTKIPTKLFLDFCPEFFMLLPGGFMEALWASWGLSMYVIS